MSAKLYVARGWMLESHTRDSKNPSIISKTSSKRIRSVWLPNKCEELISAAYTGSSEKILELRLQLPFHTPQTWGELDLSRLARMCQVFYLVWG
jgi:hypothetical protein